MLNQRQRRFAEAYVGSAKRNGWRAAWIAGYGRTKPGTEPTGSARRSLTAQASRLLKHPGVAAHIDELNSRRTPTRRTMTVRQLCAELSAKGPAIARTAGSVFGVTLRYTTMFAGAAVMAAVGGSTQANPKELDR